MLTLSGSSSDNRKSQRGPIALAIVSFVIGNAMLGLSIYGPDEFRAVLRFASVVLLALSAGVALKIVTKRGRSKS